MAVTSSLLVEKIVSDIAKFVFVGVFSLANTSGANEGATMLNETVESKIIPEVLIFIVNITFIGELQMTKNTQALIIALISGITVIVSNHLSINPFGKVMLVFLIILAAALILNKCFEHK